MGKDVSVNEIAIKLLDQFALYMYPRKALLGTVEETQAALIEVAKAYLYGSSPSSEKGVALDNILKHLTALS